MSGLTHPYSGLDHILGMLAVGVWAARNQGLRRWYVPAAFVGGMVAGGMLGFAGGIFFAYIVPDSLESAVAASVLASTLMVALAVRLPLIPQLALAMIFAVWHGIAHGIDGPQAGGLAELATGRVAPGALGEPLERGVRLGRDRRARRGLPEAAPERTSVNAASQRVSRNTVT